MDDADALKAARAAVDAARSLRDQMREDWGHYVEPEETLAAEVDRLEGENERLRNDLHRERAVKQINDMALLNAVAERDRLAARLSLLSRAYTELNIVRHGLKEVLDSVQRQVQDSDRQRRNVGAERDRWRAVVEQALNLGEDEGMQRGKTPYPDWWILLDRALDPRPDESAEATDG